MAYYPIGVGQTVSIPVVNDGREREQTMLRANTSAQQRQQAARQAAGRYQRNPGATDAAQRKGEGLGAVLAGRGVKGTSSTFRAITRVNDT